MISIIIPVYNQADKIASCLDSFLKQTYNDYEIIIVNDGSNDNIDEVLNSYGDRFLSNHLTIINQDNAGSNPARNRGAQEAGGELLLFCDADITLEPKMLELMVQALKNNPDKSFVYCSYMYGPKLFKLWAYDADRLKQMPYIHTTSLIRAEHFPRFDEQIKRLQDWDLWLTMMEQGHAGLWLDQVLFKVELGGVISTWLPSFAYKLLPFLPQVKKYKKSVEIIKKKHKLL